MKNMGRNNSQKKIDLKNFSTQIVILCIITIVSVIILLVNPETLYIDLFVIFVITLLSIYICLKEIKNRNFRIQELSRSVDIVLKDSLNLIDIPMVMINDKMQIIWQNTVSKRMLPKEYIIDVAFKLEKILKNSKSATVIEDIGNGEVYAGIGNYIKFSDFDCMLISFINKTDEKNLKDTLEDTRITVGMIFVDNYEETLQGLDEIKKAEISSQLTKVIMELVIENNGVLTKVDKDKYVMFV